MIRFDRLSQLSLTSNTSCRHGNGESRDHSLVVTIYSGSYAKFYVNVSSDFLEIADRAQRGSSRSPSARRKESARSSRRSHCAPSTHHHPSKGTDPGSEGHRVADCTDTRRFSVSRRSFQHDPSPYRIVELLPSSNPRGPWLLAQALVLFRGLRPILIHVGVSTVLCRVGHRKFLSSSRDATRRDTLGRR